jgi:predicted N-acetyltransferase YhbS
MLQIRGEKPEDIAEIHEVHELAFRRPAEGDLVDACAPGGKQRCRWSRMRMSASLAIFSSALSR